MKSLLREKNVQIIFSSQLVSAVCDKVMTIGLVWYLTTAFSIGVVPWFLAISFLPHLILSFFTTRIIRQLTPLRSVLYSELYRGFVLLFLFFLLKGFGWHGQVELTALFVTAFLIGIGSAIFNPAILSLPTLVVSENKVVGLNALIDSSLSFSTVLGAAIGVMLLTWMDLPTMILVNAVSYLWAGALQSRLSLLPRSAEIVPVASSVTVRQVLRSHPQIARMLGSFLFINLAFTPILVFIPWVVEQVYTGTARTLSTLEGAMGLGAIASAAYYTMTGMRLEFKVRIRMIATVAFCFGLLFILLAYTTSWWQGASVLFVVGLLNAFLNIEVLSFFQTSLKEDEVPAVMTAVNLISVASIPLSMSLTGLVFPYVNVPHFAVICGAITVVVSLLLPRLLQPSYGK